MKAKNNISTIGFALLQLATLKKLATFCFKCWQQRATKIFYMKACHFSINVGILFQVQDVFIERNDVFLLIYVKSSAKHATSFTCLFVTNYFHFISQSARLKCSVLELHPLQALLKIKVIKIFRPKASITPNTASEGVVFRDAVISTQMYVTLYQWYKDHVPIQQLKSFCFNVPEGGYFMWHSSYIPEKLF